LQIIGQIFAADRGRVPYFNITVQGKPYSGLKNLASKY